MIRVWIFGRIRVEDFAMAMTNLGEDPIRNGEEREGEFGLLMLLLGE